MQQTIDTIRTEILEAIASDQLVLPTMPEVALRLREVADNENSTVQSIAKVIGNDAALTARIIRIANSPLVRGAQHIEDLQMAVSRMGMEYTANLAIGIAMEQLFQATSDAVDQRMRQTWEHSTRVAGLSHVLCQHFTDLSPDQATLAGLVHEIGKLPILAWADENDWDEELLDKVLGALHPELGKMILEAWDFPEELCKVPFEYAQFDRTSSFADYTDIVMVANLQSYSSDNNPFSDIDFSHIQAFDNLGIDVDIILAENEDLENEVASAQSVFH